MQSYRFHHYNLLSGYKLTTCILLDKNIRELHLGFYIWQPKYNRRGEERKRANDLAYGNMFCDKSTFVISDIEPFNCDYINLRALIIIQYLLKKCEVCSSDYDIINASVANLILDTARLFLQRIGVLRFP